MPSYALWKMTPHYTQNLWGGVLLREAMGKDIPDDHTGESWEVSAHPHGQSRVASGPLAGLTLEAAIAADPAAFYGAHPQAAFPLLIKLLGPAQTLSVQVHPSDAQAGPGEQGKSEAWVVLSAPPGARLIAGVCGGPEELSAAIARQDVASCLRQLPVRAGDVLPIPPGLVHALTQDIVVYEIQQNSDTTFRLYDWDRVDAMTGQPRQLHQARAAEVIDYGHETSLAQGLRLEEDGLVREVLIAHDLFALERLTVCGPAEDDLREGFAAYTVVEGELQLGEETLHKGDSLVAPAAAGQVPLRGRGVILKGSAPGRTAMEAWLTGRGVPQAAWTRISGLVAP